MVLSPLVVLPLRYRRVPRLQPYATPDTARADSNNVVPLPTNGSATTLSEQVYSARRSSINSGENCPRQGKRLVRQRLVKSKSSWGMAERLMGASSNARKSPARYLCSGGSVIAVDSCTDSKMSLFSIFGKVRSPPLPRAPPDQPPSHRRGGEEVRAACRRRLSHSITWRFYHCQLKQAPRSLSCQSSSSLLE